MKNLVLLAALVGFVMFMTGSFIFMWVVNTNVSWYGALIVTAMCFTLLICLTGLLIEAVKSYIAKQ